MDTFFVAQQKLYPASGFTTNGERIETFGERVARTRVF